MVVVPVKLPFFQKAAWTSQVRAGEWCVDCKDIQFQSKKDRILFCKTVIGLGQYDTGSSPTTNILNFDRIFFDRKDVFDLMTANHAFQLETGIDFLLSFMVVGVQLKQKLDQSRQLCLDMIQFVSHHVYKSDSTTTFSRLMSAICICLALASRPLFQKHLKDLVLVDDWISKTIQFRQQDWQFIVKNTGLCKFLDQYRDPKVSGPRMADILKNVI